MSLLSSVLTPSGAATYSPYRRVHMAKMGHLSKTVHKGGNDKTGGRNMVTLAAYDQSLDSAAEYIPQPSAGYHFHPPIWKASDFISSSSTDLDVNPAGEERLIELKNDILGMISSAGNDPFKKLELVDKIQQLGVGYHFEDDIERILQHTYNDHEFNKVHCVGLYYDSLRFRLLRQAGFYMSPEIFSKYKDDKGEFDEKLASDVQGMLSLHEATYLGIHGEGILEKAQTFTTKHLNAMVTHLPPRLASQVQRALNVTLYRGVGRVNARHCISLYQEDKYRNETLLEFAKLDFNNLQLLHRKELLELFEWCECFTIGLKVELPFEFKDRVAEGYLMSMGINPEPNFSLGRVHLGKLWMLFTIFDDAHDVYCNLEELRPLRDAVLRWDVENLDELTRPMRRIFMFLMSVMKEFEVDMIKKQHFIGMPYLKKQFQIYANALFKEATMLHLKDPPKMETYQPISVITIGCQLTIVLCVMNLGELATKELYDWLDNDPDGMVFTLSLITRLYDDIATYKIEKQRGQTVSNMFCYMKEYGVSEQEAARGLRKRIDNLWKDLSRGFLRPTPVPPPVSKIILAIVQLMVEYFNHEDGYSEAEGYTREVLASLLKDPIPN